MGSMGSGTISDTLVTGMPWTDCEMADWPKETEQKLRRETLKGATTTTQAGCKVNHDFV